MITLLKSWKSIVIGLLLVYSSIVLYQYQTTSKELESLKTQYSALETKLQEQVIENSNQKLSCAVDKNIAYRDCVLINDVDKKQSSLMDEIKAIPSAPDKQFTPYSDKDEANQINIDSMLPDDLQRVLDKADNHYKNRIQDNSK